MKTNIGQENQLSEINIFIYYDVAAGRGSYDEDYPVSEYTDSDQSEIYYEDLQVSQNESKPEYRRNSESSRNYRNDGYKGYRKDDYKYRNDDYHPRKDNTRQRRDDYRYRNDDYRSKNDGYRPKYDEYKPRNDDYRPRNRYIKSKYSSQSSNSNDNNYRYGGSKNWIRDSKKDNNFHSKDNNYQKYQQKSYNYKKFQQEKPEEGSFANKEIRKVLVAQEWQPNSHSINE